MNETKYWYQSRTVWASIVTIVIACCSMSGGASLDDVNEAALVEALLQFATAVAGVIALFGRLFAEKRIE